MPVNPVIRTGDAWRLASDPLVRQIQSSPLVAVSCLTTTAPPTRSQLPGGLAMPRWTRGEAEVEQLIARGELERVTGAAADGTLLLEQARKTAATAAGLVSSDAYSAYVLAYDAARFACIALLAQQGLRATTSGGHYAVEQAVRAQFGDGFRPVRGSPAAPQRAGIPAPARRYSHVGGSRTGSRDSAEAYHRRRQAAAPIVLLQPRSGVTDRTTAGNRGMESCVPCCSRPATVSLSCRREQAQVAPHANRRPSRDPERQ